MFIAVVEFPGDSGDAPEVFISTRVQWVRLAVANFLHEFLPDGSESDSHELAIEADWLAENPEPSPLRKQQWASWVIEAAVEADVWVGFYGEGFSTLHLH